MVWKIQKQSKLNQVPQLGKSVTLAFTATWWQACQAIAPTLNEHAEGGEDNAALVKVDVKVNAEAAEACKISRMLTFQFYKGVSKVREILGTYFEGLKDVFEK